jgi:general secretion pathway protein M
MNKARLATWYPLLAAASYLVIVAAFVCSGILGLFSISEKRDALRQTLENLKHFQRRAEQSAPKPMLNETAWPSGSAFLKGQTSTMASAALLQRVSEAVAKAGGVLESSEASVQEQSNRRYLKVNATFEVEQVALQALLYDLEAGMPFLFIDNILIVGEEQNNTEKVRVSAQVSGQWDKPK